MKKKLLFILLSFLFLFTVLIIIANRYVNDEHVPVKNIASIGDRVLFIFAHPDDEIMAAGTLAGLNDSNIPTGLVYLTHGENGPTGGLVLQEELGEERFKEVESIKNILGVDYLKVLHFPDNDVKGIQPDLIKQSMLESIKDFEPTVIVGFDETVGLYGHEDHRLAGLYLHQLLDQLRALPEFSFVSKYYMVTLPQPMINLALKMSRIFKERYPRDPERGLPKANMATRIWKYGASKRKVLEAHETQWEVISDVQPYGMSVHPLLYYRIFDKEYYHRVF